MGHAPAAGCFDSLVKAIVQVHERLRDRAARAVDVSLTLRNWLFGFQIHEYELKGSDRATYGDRLLEKLADKLQDLKIPRTDERELRRYRKLYLVYPQIRDTLSPEFGKMLASTTKSQIRDSANPESCLTGKMLIDRLSFTHLRHLIELNDPFKRAFYEAECLSGQWSVAELKRQIDTLYYERSGLSKDKAKLSRLANDKAEKASPADAIRDPYVFEFLGYKPQEVLPEAGLEASLLDKLRDFLLELGRGFCFEARQKRIVIGGEHFFVDLVLYHRLLKCHVLIELKVGGFSHEHLGQLNTYLNWYRAQEMAPDDNAPIGILLCTRKNQALVEYACAGMDNRLFVSKYQLGLPKKEELSRFLQTQLAASRPPAAHPPP